MNKQRKVVITTTYNEMGIIIDTKAEEVPQPNLQPTCNGLATDCISRQAAIKELESGKDKKAKGEIGGFYNQIIENDIEKLKKLPSVQPVLTCDGCRHVGTYDTDFPCNGCVRREKDYYDPER